MTQLPELLADIDGLASERFPDLAVSYPESIRVYQEKPKFTELENGHTRMTIKQVLIPKTRGDSIGPDLNRLVEQ